MARQTQERDVSPILAAAEHWIKTCLIEDRSVFLVDSRWTAALVDEVYGAFVEHPDLGNDDFMTKLGRTCRLGSGAGVRRLEFAAAADVSLFVNGLVRLHQHGTQVYK